MDTEINKLLIDKGGLTETTKKNYVNQYKTIVRILGKPIAQATEDFILEKFEDLKPNVEKLYLNLVVMILNNENIATPLLDAYRIKLRSIVDNYYIKKKSKTDETLPDIKDIIKYTNKLYDDKLYVKYIINYLIITYGVRNKDVDVFITDSSKNIKDTINYIIVNKSQATWIINDYKTLKNYGTKKIIIKSKKFLDALKNIEMNSWLLKTSDNNHIEESGLATILKRMLYNNLTEGTYFKIIMKSINSKDNAINRLQYYSATRGTNYQNLIQFYNTSANDFTVEEEEDI